MIRKLADAFVAGKVDPALVQRAREDGFRAFELAIYGFTLSKKLQT